MSEAPKITSDIQNVAWLIGKAKDAGCERISIDMPSSHGGANTVVTVVWIREDDNGVDEGRGA